MSLICDRLADRSIKISHVPFGFVGCTSTSYGRACAKFVMAGLVTASRVYPTCGAHNAEFGQARIPMPSTSLMHKKTRRGCPAAQTSLRSLRKLDCVPGMTSELLTAL
jgi:hypothetical protein